MEILCRANVASEMKLVESLSPAGLASSTKAIGKLDVTLWGNLEDINFVFPQCPQNSPVTCCTGSISFWVILAFPTTAVGLLFVVNHSQVEGHPNQSEFEQLPSRFKTSVRNPAAIPRRST